MPPITLAGTGRRPAMPTLHALDWLREQTSPAPAQAVIFGGDRFLQLESLRCMMVRWGGDDPDFAVSRLPPDTASWADIHDHLASGSLFSSGGRRLVVLDEADEFVRRQREELERRLERVEECAASNTLVLTVTQWLATTRLYKLLDRSGLQVDCGPPMTTHGRSKQIDDQRICQWMIERAREPHGFELTLAAARAILELQEVNFGMFDSQLAKLACFVPASGRLSPEAVREVVGGWRAATTWQAIDAALDGNIPRAMTLFDRLAQSGEHPIALFAQIGWALRRYAGAVEFRDRGERNGRVPRVRDCLSAAGFKNWSGELESAERRIRRMGAPAARRLLRELLEVDRALKGTHSSDDRGRQLLESFLLRLAMPAPAADEAAAGEPASGRA